MTTARELFLRKDATTSIIPNTDNNNKQSRKQPSINRMLLLSFRSSLSIFFLTFSVAAIRLAQGQEAQRAATFRTAVLHSAPYAIVTQHDNGTTTYSGFEPDLLAELTFLAAQDGVSLIFELSPSPEPFYNTALDLVANDCNTTVNPRPLEACQAFDMIAGDYFPSLERHQRVELTPSWLTSGQSALKYLNKKNQSTFDVTTLTEAQTLQAPVCVIEKAITPKLVLSKFPQTNLFYCANAEVCVEMLKAEKCALWVADRLKLYAMTLWDATLEVTGEQLNTQYLVFPLRQTLAREELQILEDYLYVAVANGTMDRLYAKYFQRQLCPIGTAGDDCELPCDPNHGQANVQGTCTCVSIKWTGPDCATEVPQDMNFIPKPLKAICYSMVAVNFSAVFFCAIWLFCNRHTTQVKASQPVFLLSVLLGCLISTSTILALVQEDDHEQSNVPACMAIPWLYSVGFSVTFGSLFGKIRRVYLLFASATEMRRKVVTTKDTVLIIGAILFLDVTILTVWTVVDPLQWQRDVLLQDQFGEALESEGFCTSDHWVAFTSLLAALHFLLMAVACYMCYMARAIPSQFSEGKFVSIAMVSNLQIFLIGLPVLILVGSEPSTSVFVRSGIVWMNDLVVVALIFGNLIYSSLTASKSDRDITQPAMIGEAVRKFGSVRRSSIGFGRQSTKPMDREQKSGKEAQFTAIKEGAAHHHLACDMEHVLLGPKSPGRNNLQRRRVASTGSIVLPSETGPSKHG